MTSDLDTSIERRLSSRISNLHWLWVLFVLLPPVLILRSEFDARSTLWWVLPVGLIAGGLIQRKLVCVDLADDSLIFRDTLGFRREIVPLAEIETVRSILINGYVLIRFSTVNCFGNSILFIPRVRLISNMSRHSYVVDLTELVREARLKGASH